MSNVAARSLLRQGLARSQAGKSYDVARASIAHARRPICQRSEQRPVLASTAPGPSIRLPRGVRSFHASPTSLKKKGREKSNEAPAKSNSKNSGSNSKSNSSAGSADTDDGPKHPQPNPEEPLNFADVESRLHKHAEHYRDALKKHHSGWRFDPDVVGALRVTVDKKTGESYPLRELAQVVPRGGRAVSLLVHEAEYVKPILSAVQGSPDFNQQPQRDADNELELVLKIEPEKRDDVVKKVKAVAHEWRERIRAVRQKRDKLHATWKKDGVIVPDLKRSADKELDKVIKAAIAEVDELEKSTLKITEEK